MPSFLCSKWTFFALGLLLFVGVLWFVFDKNSPKEANAPKEAVERVELLNHAQLDMAPGQEKRIEQRTQQLKQLVQKRKGTLVHRSKIRAARQEILDMGTCQIRWSELYGRHYDNLLWEHENDYSTQDTQCPVCEGKEMVKCFLSAEPEHDCARCEGTGEYFKKMCLACEGSGKCFNCQGSGLMYCDFCDQGLLIEGPPPSMGALLGDSP